MPLPISSKLFEKITDFSELNQKSKNIDKQLNMVLPGAFGTNFAKKHQLLYNFDLELNLNCGKRSKSFPILEEGEYLFKLETLQINEKRMMRIYEEDGHVKYIKRPSYLAI